VRLLDANLLLYASNEDAPLHRPARTWLERSLAEDEPIGFAWLVLLAFLRLTTKPGLFPRPLSVTQSWEAIEAWLAQPSATIVHPTARHAATLRELTLAMGTGGNLTTDAHLAALAIEHGAELCSCDGDFARIPGLRWRDPLS
jgi:toxin-antitoxin system PIN domain toxin